MINGSGPLNNWKCKFSADVSFVGLSEAKNARMIMIMITLSFFQGRKLKESKIIKGKSVIAPLGIPVSTGQESELLSSGVDRRPFR